ncbi:MAG: HAD-IB family hydrolase [Gallionella sp.]
MSQPEVVAAFDFDGTLTRRDTLLPFLLHTLGARAVMVQALRLSRTLAAYALGLIDNGIAKERVFVACLEGKNIEALQQEADVFAAQVVPGLLRADAMRRLAWHKQQGHRCVLISASLELYASPWAKIAGFDEVIATQLEISDDRTLTGRMSGVNCFGAEKLRRLVALLGERSTYTLYAYGDSRGDRELLASADFSYYRQFPESR